MNALAIIPTDISSNSEGWFIKQKVEDASFLRTLPSHHCYSYHKALDILKAPLFSYDLILTTYSPDRFLPPKDRLPQQTELYGSSRQYVSKILHDNPFAIVVVWSGADENVKERELSIHGPRLHWFNRHRLAEHELRSEGEMDELQSAIKIAKVECQVTITDKDEVRVDWVCGRSPIAVVPPQSNKALPLRLYIRTAMRLIDDQIREFQYLLNEEVSEGEIELFLRSHPHFLLGNKYKSLRWQIHLKRTTSNKDDLIPDIILEPISLSERWKIQDLKLPAKRIVRTANLNRRGFNSAVLAAVHQLREYRDYFDNPVFRVQMADLGITAYKPDISVIIGRDYGGLSAEEIIKAKGDFKDLEVMTYTELIDRVRNNMRWLAGAIEGSP